MGQIRGFFRSDFSAFGAGLILLMGGLEFGGKRVSAMTQNVSNSVVDPSWYGQVSHQNTGQNLFF